MNRYIFGEIGDPRLEPLVQLASKGLVFGAFGGGCVQGGNCFCRFLPVSTIPRSREIEALGNGLTVQLHDVSKRWGT